MDDWTPADYNDDWQRKPEAQWTDLDHRNNMHFANGIISSQQTQDENDARVKRRAQSRMRLFEQRF
jgi:hypothetical protein